jgi:hypothetical protein
MLMPPHLRTIAYLVEFQTVLLSGTVRRRFYVPNLAEAVDEIIASIYKSGEKIKYIEVATLRDVMTEEEA